MEKHSELDKIKGDVKETVGNIVNDKELETEGKQENAIAKAKEVTESAKDKVNDIVDKFKNK